MGEGWGGGGGVLDSGKGRGGRYGSPRHTVREWAAGGDRDGRCEVPTTAPDRSAVRQLVCIAAVQVLVMATWFSASAVVPALRTEWALGTAGATWLTVSVQLGFVTGALTAAVLNLADRVPRTGSSRSARCSRRRTAAVAILADGLALAIRCGS